jgi:membrane protein YqaA with SNARE-associated domain
MALTRQPDGGDAMFRRLYDWTLRWAASRHAPAALGVVSVIESSIFPVPTEVLFVPMVLSRPEAAMRDALIASVGSVLGGVLGWLLGFYLFDVLARPVLEIYGKMDAFEALKASTGDGAVLAMLVTSGAVHLPPMKVVTILAGVIAFNLPLFILAAIVARGGKFFALAWAVRRYGAVVVDVMERRFTLVAGIGLLAVLAVWLGLKLT